jgi:MFS family permease
MMVVFFIGIGLASIATGFANSPIQIGFGLFVIGMFAAIYHPVGLAIVTMKWRNTGMRIATNGVWGNLGVACAALITGYLIDNGGWRLAFYLPGIVSIFFGLAYWVVQRDAISADRNSVEPASNSPTQLASSPQRSLLIRVSVIVFVTTAVSSIIFQSTTFALPKIFDERLQGLVADVAALWSGGVGGEGNGEYVATVLGSLTFLVFAVASIAQLIVGSLLDRFGPRRVFMVLATMQLVFFALMPGLSDGIAFAVALGFMLGAFGQIPINDYMIGKMASGAHRARIYGIRYVVAFSVLAMTLPLVAYVYQNWGFDTLFQILAAAAFVILCAVSLLPKILPTSQEATARA